MHNRIFSAIILIGVLFLVGCQTTSLGGSFFIPSLPKMTLAQSVQDALSRTGDPYISQVHVETAQNNVILSGYVKKIKQSDIAEQIAKKVPGVQNVENHIIIRPH